MHQTAKFISEYYFFTFICKAKKKLIASFSGTATFVFLLPHWSFLHWGKKIVSFPVRSVSLLIVIIVSKAFMSKACMVVSGISCHCIWTNTDYYNKKKVPLCLIKMFGNWPGKLIIFFPWPNSATFYCSAYTKPGKWVVM